MEEFGCVTLTRGCSRGRVRYLKALVVWVEDAQEDAKESSELSVVGYPRAASARLEVLGCTCQALGRFSILGKAVFCQLTSNGTAFDSEEKGRLLLLTAGRNWLPECPFPLPPQAVVMARTVPSAGLGLFHLLTTAQSFLPLCPSTSLSSTPRKEPLRLFLKQLLPLSHPSIHTMPVSSG